MVSEESRVSSMGGSKYYTWAISRTADRAGNYSDYSYAKDAKMLEHKISRIDCMGTVAILSYNSFVFEYESRLDPMYSFRAVSVMFVKNRLAFIKTYADGSLVKKL